jgi:hypothetical protein
VLNEFGSHGNTFSTESIWNSFSDYGSSFSDLGVCNSFATNPPVIVDDKGSYYGRLTLNEFHAEIGSGKLFVEWLKNKVCK